MKTQPGLYIKNKIPKQFLLKLLGDFHNIRFTNQSLQRKSVKSTALSAALATASSILKRKLSYPLGADAASDPSDKLQSNESSIEKSPFNFYYIYCITMKNKCQEKNSQYPLAVFPLIYIRKERHKLFITSSVFHVLLFLAYKQSANSSKNT